MRGPLGIALALALLAAAGCGGGEDPGEGLFRCQLEDGCGPAMRPGQNCLRCHTEGAKGPGTVAALPFTAAGTVFEDRRASANEGSAGVTVELNDADGKQVRLTTNRWGNFYTEEPLHYPLRLVRLLRGGEAISMPLDPDKAPAFTGEIHPEEDTYYAPAGSCNACHAVPPIAGAPGRIYAP
jgi:hypothetical protein